LVVQSSLFGHLLELPKGEKKEKKTSYDGADLLDSQKVN